MKTKSLKELYDQSTGGLIPIKLLHARLFELTSLRWELETLMKRDSAAISEYMFWKGHFHDDTSVLNTDNYQKASDELNLIDKEIQLFIKQHGEIFQNGEAELEISALYSALEGRILVNVNTPHDYWSQR